MGPQGLIIKEVVNMDTEEIGNLLGDIQGDIWDIEEARTEDLMRFVEEEGAEAAYYTLYGADLYDGEEAFGELMILAKVIEFPYEEPTVVSRLCRALEDAYYDWTAALEEEAE